MKRRTVFAKGNVDVHDALHSCRLGGKIVWNGINEALRVRHPEWSVRLRHETFTRSDALLRATGHVPHALTAMDLPLGAYPLASQFGRAVFESDADAVVLSLQPDIMTPLLRHRENGYVLYPSDAVRWSVEQRETVHAAFEPIEPLSVAASMENFFTIVHALRERSDAPILVFNVSAVTPGEMLHSYLGLEETLSSRMKAFNLGLIRLSQETDIAIVDVDTLVARHGADALKLDATHLTADGYRLVANEVVRIFEELEFF